VAHSLADVCEILERLWPADGAEAWDASGLVSGHLDAPIERILLTVDAVAETVDEAVGADADLLIAHHPLLLRGVTTIAEDRYKGSLLARLIRANCALVAAHTNADVVADGTSAVFADLLGLRQTRPIIEGTRPNTGIGRIGRTDEPTTLGRFARRIADILPATASGVRVAGDYDAPISTVALCAGAGDAYIAERSVVASDVYVTSDLRHHPASEAREQALLRGGPALIDVSHWASEWLWLHTAQRQLRHALPDVSISVSQTRTDPWDFAIVQ